MIVIDNHAIRVEDGYSMYSLLRRRFVTNLIIIVVALIVRSRYQKSGMCKFDCS